MNTESNYDMKTKLERIAEISTKEPNEKFNSIIHHINPEMLLQCHKEMVAKKATGMDAMDKQTYEEKLEKNIQDLWTRLKSFSYRPQAIKRVYIPKTGSDKLRPLGIPCYEDRLVQSAMAKLMNAIWEPRFVESSYGFRPRRGCHQALGALAHILETKEIRYVVDVDIKSYFDTIDHDYMVKFVEHKVSDQKFIRLLKRVLKAYISDNGKINISTKGAPQGGQISPICANIYLHYVLDLWFEQKVKRESRYGAYMVRYADDVACCFGKKEEAEKFYQQLKDRMEQFHLELSEEKCKILEFGRYAKEECQKRGEKVQTFDFLGFTHYASTDRTGRRFRVKRTTSKKKRW